MIFSKICFFQKKFPSNSEQVWKTIYMVKIKSLASRSIFHDFLVIFPKFGVLSKLQVDFLRNFSNLCTSDLEIYPTESLQIFVRAVRKPLLWYATKGAWITSLTKKFFGSRKKNPYMVGFLTHINKLWDVHLKFYLNLDFDLIK